jgi:hypothetical protein
MYYPLGTVEFDEQIFEVVTLGLGVSALLSHEESNRLNVTFRYS